MAKKNDPVREVRHAVGVAVAGEFYPDLEEAEQIEPGMGTLIGALMLRNARDLQRNFEMMYESEKAAHERTKERLEAALARLEKIEIRAGWLLGHHDHIDERDWR